MEKSLQKIIQNRNKILRPLNIGMAAMRLFQNEEVPIILAYFDLRTIQFIAISDSVINILGYSPSEMEGVSFTNFVLNEQEIVKSISVVNDNLMDARPVKGFRNTYRHADGKNVVPINWFADGSIDGRTFCIGFPDDPVPINSLIKNP